MDVRIATGDAEVAACYPVMRELRPHLDEEEFLRRVRLQAADGYTLAALWDGGAPVGVAGFRVRNNLASGRFLYVDDLVTASVQRSKGYGSALLRWLAQRARELGCAEIQLDSGLQRTGAHRFYEREGMSRVGYYFRMALGPAGDAAKG